MTMVSRVVASLDTAGLIRASPSAKGGEVEEGPDQSLAGVGVSGETTHQEEYYKGGLA